ncbi:MAG TPA: host-nuclease inhibitor Gam family protein [Nevskiales bacterium]|nr:host-nuclease inhibitor Gam family protein [Nevskiales bacterium]
MSMETIETKTRAYAEARSVLASRVEALNEELDKARRRSLPGIKRALGIAKAAEEDLRAEIEAHPELFEKPRSVILHGVRVGYQKAKGTIEWDDDDRVVALIQKHHPDLFDNLVKTIERPIKTALNTLSVADLKKIGVTVVEAGDQVVIKPVDSDVDKLVDALLRDASEDSDSLAA